VLPLSLPHGRSIWVGSASTQNNTFTNIRPSNQPPLFFSGTAPKKKRRTRWFLPIPTSVHSAFGVTTATLVSQFFPCSHNKILAIPSPVSGNGLPFLMIAAQSLYPLDIFPPPPSSHLETSKHFLVPPLFWKLFKSLMRGPDAAIS